MLQQFNPLGEFDKQGNALYYYPLVNSIVSSRLIKIKEMNYKKAFEIAEWRFLTQYPIVKIYHGHLTKETRQGCNINILIDHFDLFFQNLYEIPLPQSLYLVKTIITALEKLIQKFGYFDLTNKMIGITKNKQCKVWINQDLTSFIKMKDCLNEQTMLNKLFNMIEQRTQINDISKQFFDLASGKCTSFVKSQNFINHFVFEQEMVIPHLFIRQKMKPLNKFQLLGRKCNDLSKYSFISNQNQKTQKEIFFNLKNQEKIQRKSQLILIRSQQVKDSFIKHGSMAPTQISFTYQSSNGNKIRGSQIFKSPISHTSILKQQRKSVRPIVAKSAKNSPKKDQCSKSQPYLGFLKNFKAKGSIVSQGNKSFIKANDPKRMSIISTLSLKINSQPNSLSPKNSQKIKKQLQSEYEQQQENNKMKKMLFKQNFQNKGWKNTISQLFSSDMNLKQSMSYGQQQKAYLKDIDLKKLNKFGRFIATSVLQRDQDQQSQHVIGQFLNIN